MIFSYILGSLGILGIILSIIYGVVQIKEISKYSYILQGYGAFIITLVVIIGITISVILLLIGAILYFVNM